MVNNQNNHQNSFRSITSMIIKPEWSVIRMKHLSEWLYKNNCTGMVTITITKTITKLLLSYLNNKLYYTYYYVLVIHINNSVTVWGHNHNKCMTSRATLSKLQYTCIITLHNNNYFRLWWLQVFIHILCWLVSGWHSDFYHKLWFVLWLGEFSIHRL